MMTQFLKLIKKYSILLMCVIFLTGGFGFLDILCKSKERFCEEWKENWKKNNDPRDDFVFKGSFLKPFQKAKGDNGYCFYIEAPSSADQNDERTSSNFNVDN